MTASRGRPKRGEARLSPDRVAAAGLAFLDKVGFERFSLRGLAARLKATPMAVLHHAGSIEGLFAAMVPLAFDPPSDSGSESAAPVVDQLLAYGQVALTHPGLVRATFSYPRLTEAQPLDDLNAKLISALMAGGMPQAMATRCRDTLVDFLHGRMLALTTHPEHFDEEETRDAITRVIAAFA